MNSHPPATIILEAAARFLQADVLPLLTGATAFNMRVAINALGMVQRELELKPAHDAAALELLQNLLGSQEGNLAELEEKLLAGIADGTLGFDDPAVAITLRQMAVQQLAIDQPKYSAYVAAKAAD